MFGLFNRKEKPKLKGKEYTITEFIAELQRLNNLGDNDNVRVHIINKELDTLWGTDELKIEVSNGKLIIMGVL